MLTVRHYRGTFSLYYAGDLPDPDTEEKNQKLKTKKKKEKESWESFAPNAHAEEDCTEEYCEYNCHVKKRTAPFREWLKLVFQPSHQRIFGELQMNPVIFFHITKLSPGYVGGLISHLTYT